MDQGAKWSPVFGRYGFLAGKGVRERKGKGEEVRLSVGMGMEVRRRLGGRGEFGESTFFFRMASGWVLPLRESGLEGDCL